jgi:ABC-type dipeptide/oligopeptide/nickel transport system ATPase component
MGDQPTALLRMEQARVLVPGRPPTVLVDGVDLDVVEGECLGLVGESGSGKSLLLRSIVDLVPPPLRVEGRYLWKAGEGPELREFDRRRARGRSVGMIFQEPMRALNPARRVAWTLAEPLRMHRGLQGPALRDRILSLLADVGIRDAVKVSRAYPHELSGGLQQRVMIAAALATDPALLLCDEPTTALDVTTQARIIELLQSLQVSRGLSMIFVSHDLAVISEIADRVAVLEAGRLVEIAPTAQLITDPHHPYTRMLLAAIPGHESPASPRGSKGTR